MSLNLYQRHSNFENLINNTYCDDKGNTTYTIHTPSALSNRTTTISKALHDSLSEPVSNEAGTSLDDSSPPLDGDNATSLSSGTQHSSTPRPALPPNGTGTRSNFVYVAQIEWRITKDTKLRFGMGQYSGREMLVGKFFRKEGFGFWGRHRVFTGDDGKEYKWCLRRVRPELVLNDGSNTIVATFHPQRFFWGKDRARLEIFPQGQHMVDEIVVTFTYVERIRKVRQRAARH